MLLDVALHDLTVEREGLFLSQFVGELTLHRLHMIRIRDAHNVSQTVGLLISLVFRLAGQEGLVFPGRIDLLAQTTRWGLMLGRVFVKLLHVLVKIINLVLTELLRDRVRFVDTTRAQIVLIISNFFSRLHILNLPLHIGNLRLEGVIAEHGSALTGNLDAEVVIEATVDG